MCLCRNVHNLEQDGEPKRESIGALDNQGLGITLMPQVSATERLICAAFCSSVLDPSVSSPEVGTFIFTAVEYSINT